MYRLVRSVQSEMYFSTELFTVAAALKAVAEDADRIEKAERRRRLV